MWRWAGTDKLTCGHGLALQELGSGGQESIASLLFERYLVVLYALIFHFSSETKLTCQNRPEVTVMLSANQVPSKIK